MSAEKSAAELFFTNRPFTTQLGNFKDSSLNDSEVTKL